MRLAGALLLAVVILGTAAGLTHAEEEAQAQEEAQAGEQEQQQEVGEGDEEEEKEVKEKTEEIMEEKDVMVLHINNFHRALKENKYLLVEFYAPWCGHCQRLEPVWAEAAGRLKGAWPGAGAGLAKVDAIEESELAEEFQVQSFPTIKFFSDGQRDNPATYTGKRTTEGILQWLERRMGPGATSISTTEGAQEFIDANNVTVVGFFKSLDAEAVKVFYEVAMDVVDMNFGIVSSPEIFTHFGLETDTVVLFKKFDEKRADLPVPEKLDKDEAITFIRDNAMPLVIQFSEENAEKIFGSKVHNHLLLFLNSTLPAHNALLSDYRATASTFKGKILFILIDTNGAVSHVLKYFGLSESDAPAVRLINTDTVKKYAMPPGGAITTHSLKAFCQGVLDGTVKPHMMSQELPADWADKPLKVLVGKNFESVAFDDTKNVFVEFYAPWCGHCKELAPIWEQLAEKYKDRDDIIIANMDSTANEVEAVTVSGFPTLKFFPAGAEKKAVDYTGKRDLESLSKFLDSGGVLPEEPDEEDEEDEDDDEDGEEEATEESTKTTNTTKDEL